MDNTKTYTTAEPKNAPVCEHCDAPITLVPVYGGAEWLHVASGQPRCDTNKRELVSTRIAEWLACLNSLKPDYAHFYLDKPGKIYTRVIGNLGGQLSVHAFVDREGNVYKADGWKRPAQYIRFDLTSEYGHDRLTHLSGQDWAGGYLYIR